MKNELFSALERGSALVETSLERLCADTDDDFGIVMDAERYSLLGGGKRIRPFLVNEFCRALGGREEASMIIKLDDYYLHRIRGVFSV